MDRVSSILLSWEDLSSGREDILLVYVVLALWTYGNAIAIHA